MSPFRARQRPRRRAARASSQSRRIPGSRRDSPKKWGGGDLAIPEIARAVAARRDAGRCGRAAKSGTQSLRRRPVGPRWREGRSKVAGGEAGWSQSRTSQVQSRLRSRACTRLQGESRIQNRRIQNRRILSLDPGSRITESQNHRFGVQGAESQSPESVRGAQGPAAQGRSTESRIQSRLRGWVRTGEEEKCRIAESRSPPGEGGAEEKCRIQSSESETRLRGLK